MDLETLKKYSSGELNPKEFLAIHRDAGELLEILQQHLHPGEYVSTLADWPAVRRRSQSKQYMTLKTMMLITPLVLVGGTAFVFKSPEITLLSGLGWLGLFGLIAVLQLVRRRAVQNSREGRSVVAVTNLRLMRIWLDGSRDVQFWRISEPKEEPMEPVPETVRVLLDVDLGKTSLN